MTGRPVFVPVHVAPGVVAYVLESDGTPLAVLTLCGLDAGAAEVVRVVLASHGLLPPADLDGDRNGPDPAA